MLSVGLACTGIANAGEPATESCTPADGLEFVCGPQNAEDLLRIPGSDWIVTSGMSGEGTSGHLYLLDPASREIVEAFPGKAPQQRLDGAAFPACPGELDTTRFSAHGLSLRAVTPQLHQVYVTSHGAREAVEVFELDSSASPPQVTWVGCVPIPEHNELNSVTSLADGGFIATRISGSTPDLAGDIFAGELSGFLYEWHPGGAVKRLPRTEMSGPNGIIISPDESRLWVGSWGRSEIARFVRATDGGWRHDRTIFTNFRVDNLRWTDTGSILAAGHRLSAKQDCGQPLCFDEWEVAEVDPETLTTTTLLVQKSLPGFLGATAALREDTGLWLGTFHGDRLVVVPADSDRNE